MAKLTFYIKRLDEGFILNHDYKDKAVTNYEALEERILALVKDKLENVTTQGCRNALLNFEIDYNLPEQG
jgi:hypothetical protein